MAQPFSTKIPVQPYELGHASDNFLSTLALNNDVRITEVCSTGLKRIVEVMVRGENLIRIPFSINFGLSEVESQTLE